MKKRILLTIITFLLVLTIVNGQMNEQSLSLAQTIPSPKGAPIIDQTLFHTTSINTVSQLSPPTAVQQKEKTSILFGKTLETTELEKTSILFGKTLETTELQNIQTSSGDKGILIVGNQLVHLQNKAQISNQRLMLHTEKSTHEITISPLKALQTAQFNKQSNIKSVELGIQKNKPVYIIHTNVPGTLFGIITATSDVETIIDATTGTKLREQKTSGFFITTE